MPKHKTISSLTDTELVIECSVSVMGWKRPVIEVQVPTGTVAHKNEFWQPLENWNHTHAVIDGMRKKGYWWALTDKGAYFEAFVAGYGEPQWAQAPFGRECRAILEAALMALWGRDSDANNVTSTARE